MKLIFNFRFFFFAAIMIIASIFIVSGALTGSYITVIAAVVIAGVFGVLAFFGITGTVGYKVKVLSFIFVLAWIASLFTYSQINQSQRRDFEGLHTVTGRAGEYIKITESKTYVELYSVTVSGKKLNSGLLLVLDTKKDVPIVSEIESGRELIINGAAIDNLSLRQSGGWNTFYYKNNMKYTVRTAALNVESGALYKPPFMTGLRNKIKAVLDDNLSPETASLSYALLTGDKSYVDDGIKNNFSAAGLSHVLAVSGLHVGFLLIVLNFILKKLRCGRLLQFIIITASLIFFCLLCSMSASVVRAAIMGIIASVAMLAGQRYDPLSSLSAAAVIILLFKPLLLFDLSFQMSFTAAFGIVLFSGGFTKAFQKIKIPRKAASSLSATLAASVGIFPVTAAQFGVIPLYSVVVNILAIPLISVLFIIVFVGTGIAVFLPFMGFLLKAAVPAAWLVNGVSEFFAALPFSTVATAGLGGTAVLYFIGLMFSSKFALLGKRFKATVAVCLLTAVLCVNLAAALS